MLLCCRKLDFVRELPIQAKRETALKQVEGHGEQKVSTKKYNIIRKVIGNILDAIALFGVVFSIPLILYSLYYDARYADWLANIEPFDHKALRSGRWLSGI